MTALSDIKTLDEYMLAYGKLLARKAVDLLDPLFDPRRDSVPDLSRYLRPPLERQGHVIAASARMLDATGNGFVCGATGTGKTLMGSCTVDLHAGGKPYRAMVLCPDHLIGKWEREIKATIPGVVVRTFENWKGVIPLIDKGHRVKKRVPVPGQDDEPDFLKKTFEVEVARWEKPLGPEFYIVGRDQAKWIPGRLGLGAWHKGFNGMEAKDRCSHSIPLGRYPLKDERGREVYDPQTGETVEALTVALVFRCPVCGEIARNRDGTPMSAENLSAKKTIYTCQGLYVQQIPDPDHDPALPRPKFQPRIYPLPDRISGRDKGSVWKEKAGMFRVMQCGSPLWSWTGKPRKFPPATIIHKKLRKMFKYLIVDEAHEQKGADSAQAGAAGKLMAASRHALCMTGTLIGGKAKDLFPLMIRMTPDTIRKEGFQWGHEMAWSQAYGKVDRIVTTTTGGDDDDGSYSVGSNSMRRSRASGKPTERSAIRPGIMPSLFGNHMLGSSVFISLEDVCEALPALFEYPGGDAPDTNDPEYDAEYQRWWVDGGVDMDDEVADEYKRVQSILVARCRALLQKGSMKLLGAMLWTLLDYPDRPYHWEPPYKGVKAVGYHERPKVYTKDNWVGVVQPGDCDVAVIRPKEQKLLDICRMHKAAGNQVWVYVQMTKTRDVQPRLKMLLEAEGLRVCIMRSTTVSPRDREAWIAKHGTRYDVIISYPKIVGTGLDFFAPDDSRAFNYSAIVFYQTGYNLFHLRQAAGRAWRIKQWKDCQVYYLYYKGTIQQKQMWLMGRKMAAAIALEGDFSSEGLIALAGEGDEQMALARSLSERINDADITNAWHQAGNKKHKGRPVALMGRAASPILLPASPLDRLRPELQLIAETLLDTELVNGIDSEFSFGELPAGILSPAEIEAMFARFQASGVSLEEVY